MAKTLNIAWGEGKSSKNKNDENGWDDSGLNEGASGLEGGDQNHREERRQKKRSKKSAKKRHNRLNIHGNSSVDSAFDSSLSNDSHSQ